MQQKETVSTFKLAELLDQSKYPYSYGVISARLTDKGQYTAAFEGVEDELSITLTHDDMGDGELTHAVRVDLIRADKVDEDPGEYFYRCSWGNGDDHITEKVTIGGVEYFANLSCSTYSSETETFDIEMLLNVEEHDECEFYFGGSSILENSFDSLSYTEEDGKLKVDVKNVVEMSSVMTAFLLAAKVGDEDRIADIVESEMFDDMDERSGPSEVTIGGVDYVIYAAIASD